MESLDLPSDSPAFLRDVIECKGWGLSALFVDEYVAEALIMAHAIIMLLCNVLLMLFCGFDFTAQTSCQRISQWPQIQYQNTTSCLYMVREANIIQLSIHFSFEGDCPTCMLCVFGRTQCTQHVEARDAHIDACRTGEDRGTAADSHASLSTQRTQV